MVILGCLIVLLHFFYFIFYLFFIFSGVGLVGMTSLHLSTTCGAPWCSTPTPFGHIVGCSSALTALLAPVVLSRLLSLLTGVTSP